MHEDFEPRGSYGNNQNRAMKEFLKVYCLHSSHLSTYFRTVYRIYELIDRSGLAEKDKYNYLKIMRAQFTRGELFFLHYNALTYPGYATRYFITRYRLTKHMAVLDYLEFKDVYRKFPSLSDERINGLNSILYHIWKDIYNIGRGKTSIEKVNKELDALSTKYKFRLDLILGKSIEIKLDILNNTRNQSHELKSFHDLPPELIRQLIFYLLKCMLVHSSFQMLNTSKLTRFSSGEIRITPSRTSIKVKAYTKNDVPLRISCFDITPPKHTFLFNKMEKFA